MSGVSLSDFLADTLADRAAKSRKGWAEKSGRIVRRDGLVEAVRYYQTEGAGFSGWIVRRIDHPNSGYSEPIPNRTLALAALLAWDADL